MTITQQTSRKPPSIPSEMRNLFLNVSVEGAEDGGDEGGGSTSIGAIGLSIISLFV